MLQSIHKCTLLLLLLLPIPIIQNEEHIEENKQIVYLSMNTQQDTLSEPSETTPSSIAPMHEFNDRYDIKEGETPPYTTKRATAIPGIEIWSIMDNPSSDPVHIEDWFVSGNVKKEMRIQEVGSLLQAINYVPRTNNEALDIAKLSFQDNKHTVVDENTITRLDIPDTIKKKLTPPKIIEKDGIYIIHLYVFSENVGARKFFNIDTRAVVGYTFEIGGPTYFNTVKIDELWMADPPGAEEESESL